MLRLREAITANAKPLFAFLQNHSNKEKKGQCHYQDRIINGPSTYLSHITFKTILPGGFVKMNHANNLPIQ